MRLLIAQTILQRAGHVWSSCLVGDDRCWVRFFVFCWRLSNWVGCFVVGVVEVIIVSLPGVLAEDFSVLGGDLKAFSEFLFGVGFGGGGLVGQLDTGK